MKSILPLAATMAAVIGLAMPAMAGPPLPREPIPRPHFPITRPGVPKPPIHLGTQPTINIHHPVALPDLKIVRVSTHLNSRVANICRTGRKDRPGSSIPVLNFDVTVKNVGRGTARMDRYGVVLSAKALDFHERVFDGNKRYQGGTGGPGHFQGPHGPQPWLLVHMRPIAPGATFVAHSGQGIGRNNTRFTIARMHELAGQTHRFRIKLTSYGSPGLRESNTRNNTYIVSYTFPRNFCQQNVVHGGASAPVGNQIALPDLKIVRVTPTLSRQAVDACRTGRSLYGVLVHFDLTVKNVGAGAADLRRYMFSIDANSVDGRTPDILGGDGYSGANRTPASVAPGQTFSVRGRAGVGGDYWHDTRFPVSRFSELAGKTRRFKVEIKKMGVAPLIESNYRNNFRMVSFTFPRNFCQQNVVHGGASAPIGNQTALPDLKIVRVTPTLSRQAIDACRTGRSTSGTLVDFKLTVKNVGAGVADLRRYMFGVFATSADLPEVPGMVGGAGFSGTYSGTGRTPARVAPGQTFTITGGFAGVGVNVKRDFPVSRFSELAGKTRRFKVAIIRASRPDLGLAQLIESNYSNNFRMVSFTFPQNFCKATIHGGISSPLGNQTIKPNIAGFQFAGGKNCVSPGGFFVIKGNTFGNSAGGRTIELGGNGVSVNLSIQSWNNRAIRVQLPRAARLRYHKNYWVRILAPRVAGSARTLSNLKRGIVLCPPTVHVGGSGASGHTVHQDGGRPVHVEVPGLPDLEISRIAISGPVPTCFDRGIYQIWGNYYTLGKFRVNITLHNRGSATYTTHDSVHNRNLPIGIIGDRYVGPPGRHHDSLCAGPDVAYRIPNLVLPAGASKTIQTELGVYTCFINDNRVVNQNGRLSEPLVRSIMGQVRSIKLGVGKAVFIRNNIPVESNYDNNFRSLPFRFPNRTCGGR